MPPGFAGMIRFEPLCDLEALAITLKRLRFVTILEQRVADCAVALGYSALPLGIAGRSSGDLLAHRKPGAIRPEGLLILVGDVVRTADPVVTICQVLVPQGVGGLERQQIFQYGTGLLAGAHGGHGIALSREHDPEERPGRDRLVEQRLAPG